MSIHPPGRNDHATAAIAAARRRRHACRAWSRWVPRGIAAVALIAVVVALLAPPLRAQNEAMKPLIDPNSSAPEPSMSPSGPVQTDNSMPPPIPKMHLRQSITGSMMVAPPYGVAPLLVGFFVLADDPEGIGFLTYSWNFGDGTVSALPPELYIYHTYQNPGTYVCTLTMKTMDGRQRTFIQGVIVRPPGD